MTNPSEPASTGTTTMFREAAEAPTTVARQEQAHAALERLGATLRRRSPPVVITLGRGSSDHAATFAKYAIETRLGVPVASAAPSVSSVYATPMRAEGALCIAISQSGRSPDLLEGARRLKSGGALVLALVNDTASPLAELADEVIDLAAGPERSVAATKSFIGSLSAIARVVAEWSDDDLLRAQIRSLPGLLEQAWQLDWSPLVRELATARDLYVLARGLGLAVAQEAALKLKETSQLHAEPFSTAEVRHGPMAIVREGFPALIFGQSDDTRGDVEDTARNLASRGARIFLSGAEVEAATTLPSIDSPPLLQPILQIQTFYRAADALARARGLDPDNPPHLAKVTETR